jgi:hypothetical protein
MVGGRTYRNVLTTSEVEIKKAEGPEKLTVLTTEKIPGPKAQPPTVGMDLSKMITTHDEPKIKEMGWIGHPASLEPPDEGKMETNAKGGYVELPKPKAKKPGRPKKAE